MDTSIRNITLDFYNNTIITVNAKQYDHKLRGILATVSENGVPVVLDSSKVSAYVRCKKPDNTVVFDKCEIDSNGKVYIELTNQILACVGRVALDIIIVKSITPTTYQKIMSSGVDVITTMTMYLNIIENIFPDEYIESQDEFSALKYALARAEYNYQHVLDQAEEYASAAKSSEEIAITKANEASISATSAATSKNNAKIYADNASNSADEASDNSILSKSYAIGGTDTRINENIDNSKYYKEYAEMFAANATVSEKNAKASEQLAKQYKNEAFYATPEGYETLVNRVGLREYCDCSLFAQSIIDKYVDDVSIYGAQSMAIGNFNETDYMLVLFTTSTTENDKDVAVLYELPTGNIVQYATNLKLGHCNGATFSTKDSNFYIACAGGDNGLNQVAVLSLELKIINTVDFQNKEIKHPYAIAYNYSNDSFYVLGTNGAIVEMDANFENILQKNTLQTKNKSYNGQGIHYDEKHISFIYNYRDSSYCDLYDTRLNYKCSQFINNFSELECGYFYKNELYLLINTSNSGLILKSSQYQDGKIFDFWNERHVSERLQVSDAIVDLYFNSETENFLLDGTIDFPFRKLYLGWSYMIGQPLRNVRMNFIGDFSESNINIKKYLGRLYIQGYNNTIAKIGGIYLRNFGNVELQYLSVRKRNDTESSLVSLYYGHTAYLKHILFDGENTEIHSLHVVGSTCETSDCHFNSDSTYHILATLGSLVVCENDNTYNGNGIIQSYSNSTIQMGYLAPMKTLTEQYNNQIVIGGSAYGDINLAKLTREGKYRIEGSSTVTNCPNNFSTGNFNLSITQFDRSIVYELISFETSVPYIGILGYNSTKIIWYTMTAIE